MKKLVIILLISCTFSIISCSRIELLKTVDFYEDPNVIIITIEKKNE